MQDTQTLQALEAIQFWKVMDFADQESIPRQACARKRAASRKKHHDIVVHIPLIAGDETPLIQRLADEVRLKDGECLSAMTVELGSVARERCIRALEGITADACGGGGKAVGARPEKNTSRIAAAEIKASCEGRALLGSDDLLAGGSFLLSPLLWLADEARRSKDSLFEMGDLQNAWQEASARSVAEMRAGRALLCDSDGRIILGGLALLLDALERHLGAAPDDAAGEKGDGTEGGVARIAVVRLRLYRDERARDEDEDYASPSFWSTFYYDDLEMVQRAIARHDVSAEVLAYAAPRGGADRPQHAIDMLHARSGSPDAERLCAFYADALHPRRMPLGRWPSQFSPALMQQLAVSLCMGSVLREGDAQGGSLPIADVNLPGFFSVNGPPGTGKTTMLKDVVAACVVEKARILARYKDPDDAFEKVVLEDARQEGWNYLDVCYGFADAGSAAGDPAAFGILVCSANNAAVENISKELPRKSELLDGLGASSPSEGEDDSGASGLAEVRALFDPPASEDRDPFFRSHAQRLFGHFDSSRGELIAEDDVWGLIAAPLGNMKNVGQFRDRVLAGKGADALSKRTAGKKSDEYRKQALEHYEDARQRFLAQLDEVERMRDALADMVDLPEELEEERCRVQHLAKRYEACERAQAELEERRARLTADFKSDMREIDPSIAVVGAIDDAALLSLHENVGRRRAEVQSSADALRRSLGKLSRRLFGKERRAEDERRLRELDAELAIQDRALRRIAEERNRRDDLADEAKAVARELKAIAEEHQNACASVEALQHEVSRAEALCAQRGIGVPDASLISDLVGDDIARRDAAYLATCWTYDEFDRAREKLFARAFELEVRFVDASRCVRKNMRILADMWGEPDRANQASSTGTVRFSDADCDRAMPHLVQSLLLAVPVVSTTFASVGRMLAHVKKRDAIGLLVIDEAGQASPWQALGSLHRSRRALVVGDPKQIEPVVSEESLLIGRVFPPRVRGYAGQGLSVQGFVDRLNPVGSDLAGGGASAARGLAERDEGATWMGSPLLVHRRCISPMFEISNSLSYGGAMSGQAREPGPKKEATFCLPTSFWLDVRGSERGNKDHFVEAQAVAIEGFIKRAFEAAEGKLPSLFVISPFTTVASGLKAHFRRRASALGVDDDAMTAWCEECIGTVHTFQGKGANEVLFVLGCDASATGAVRWVGENIVNVAVTRAKYRLCAVGDETLWAANPSVVLMKRHLDTWWADGLADGHAKSEGPSCVAGPASARPLLNVLFTQEENDSKQSEGGGEPAIRSGFFESFQEMGRFTPDCFEDDDYRLFGFNDKADFLRRFADYPDVQACLLVGMGLYLAFGVDAASERDDVGDEAAVDYSFCAIGFCKAAELYLRKRYVPLLKRAFPDYRKSNAADAPALSAWKERSFTIGTFELLFGERGGRDQAQALADITQQLDSLYDKRWWNRAASICKVVAAFRNKVCHADPIDALQCTEGVRKIMGPQAEKHPGWPLGIVREERASDLLAEGLRRYGGDGAATRERGASRDGSKASHKA